LRVYSWYPAKIAFTPNLCLFATRFEKTITPGPSQCLLRSCKATLKSGLELEKGVRPTEHTGPPVIIPVTNTLRPQGCRGVCEMIPKCASQNVFRRVLLGKTIEDRSRLMKYDVVVVERGLTFLKIQPSLSLFSDTHRIECGAGRF